MAIPKYTIPTFEELLKKNKQPKVPLSGLVGDEFDFEGAAELGYKIPANWKLRRLEGVDSLISPRGNIFKNLSLSPEGTIKDFRAFSAEGKPIDLRGFPRPPLAWTPPTMPKTTEGLSISPLEANPIEPPAPVKSSVDTRTAQAAVEAHIGRELSISERYGAQPIPELGNRYFTQALTQEFIEQPVIPPTEPKLSGKEARAIYEQRQKDIDIKYRKPGSWEFKDAGEEARQAFLAEEKQAWEEYQETLPGFKESIVGEAFLPSTKDYVPGEMPTATWFTRVEELSGTPGELIPFVGSSMEIAYIADLLKTAKRFEAGEEVGKEELLALYQYVERAQRDTTWGYKVTNVIFNMIPWGLEFLLTGGIYTAGEQVAVKASTIALQKVASKTGLKLLEKALVRYGIKVAGVVAGGTLRSVPIGLPKVASGTLEKQLQGTLTGDEEEVWLSLVKSAGENWVETVSESTGALFAPLTAPIKGQLVKLGIFKAFLKANPTKSANDIRKVMQRFGYNGIIGEMLEERVAEVGHGILYELGFGDQKFSIPSLEQLGVELAAFSVPAVAAKVIQELPGALAPVLRDERGGLRLPGKPEEVTPAIKDFLATPDEEIIRPSSEVVDALKARGFSSDYIQTKMSIPEMKQALVQPIPESVTPEVTKGLIRVESRAGGYQAWVMSDQGVEVGIGDLKVTFAEAQTEAGKSLADKAFVARLEDDWVKKGYTFKKASGISEVAIPEAEVGMPEAPVTEPTQFTDIINRIVVPALTPKAELVNLDVATFDVKFAEDVDNYVGEGGTGAVIGDRYERFKTFLETDNPIEAAEVQVKADGSVMFMNGRNRYAVFRDMGMTNIPVTMDSKSIANAKKFGYISEPEAPVRPEVTTGFIAEPVIPLLNKLSDPEVARKVTQQIQYQLQLLANRGFNIEAIKKDFINDLVKQNVSRNIARSMVNIASENIKPVAIPEAEVGMPEAVTRRVPSVGGISGVTQTQQVEYTRRMTSFLNKADADIKKVNDDFTAGKMTRAENQAQRDAINLELDKQANKIRAEMGFPEAVVTPAVEAPIEIRPEVEIQEKLTAVQNIRRFYQEKIKSYDQTKKALVDYVNKNLPLNVRGKMLASVKNVKTELGLTRAINRVNILAEQNAQKVLKVEIRKEIKKARAKIKDHILKGKFTPEVQQRLDVITHNLDMDRDVARDKMADNIRRYEDGTLSYEEMLKANEALNFAGIDGMSAEELANTLEYIKILETIGRSERQAKQATATERINTIRTDIINILTGKKGLKAGIGVVPRAQLAAKPGWLDTFVNWQYSLDNLADKLSKLDPTSAPYQSAINKFVAQAHRATNRQAVATRESYSKLKDAVKEVYGIKSTHDINQVLNGLNEEVNLGTFELTEAYKANNPEATTITIRMTRDEMIAKYMQMQDSTLNNTFEIGMGWSQEVRDTIDNTLTENEKKLSQAIFGIYEEYYTGVNEIYKELYNVNMPHNPKYSPIRRDLEGNIIENVLTFQDAQQYASVINGSLKARQRNIRPLRFNGATRVLSNHIDQMEHFKAWAATMRDFRRVFGNTQVRQAIEQYHGRGIGKLLDTFISQMARGGIETAATNRAADYLRRAFTKSILAIKPVVGLKQIPSLFGYLSEMKTTEFFGGIANFWKSPIANFQFLYKNSEGFRARVSQGFTRDIRAATARHGVKRISGSGSFTDWFLLQIRMGDTMAVTQGMWAKYQEGLKKGLSQADAIVAAEDTTNRTQPSFGIDTLSALQNGGSFLKLMTMFQNQPNKYFRLVGDNLRNFKYGRGSRAKAASTIFLVWVVLPMMFQFIADAFQWKEERQLRAGLLGPLNYILIGGQLIQTAWGWVTDQPFDYQASPVLSTIDEIQKATFKAKSMVDKGLDPYKDVSGEDVALLIEYLAKAGGQLAGLPTPYAVQVEKGIRTKLKEDKDIDIKDFLFSQWALEPPAKDAEEKVGDTNLKLGEIKEGQEDLPLTEKELKIYTTIDWFRELGNIYSKVLPQDVFDNPEASKESKAWAESEIARSKADILPNIPLYRINTEDNDDTIFHYYQQWQARQRIDSLEKLKEFDQLYPKAHLGNVSRQQYNLLTKYLEAEDKDAFLATSPDLRINPRNEWLKDPQNARGAALLVLRGQAQLLTPEAYDEFNELIKELDIPDSAIPTDKINEPPEGLLDIVPDYFSFSTEVQNGIPSDKNLWQPYFAYNKLPGSGGYLSLSQSQVDAGRLPEEYRQIWETYQKLRTDIAKTSYRKRHKNLTVNLRENFRRAKSEFDQWLQDEQGLKPLPPKAISRAGRARIAPISVFGGFGVARPRRAAVTYPKFKKPKISTGISIRAPSAPSV